MTNLGIEDDVGAFATRYAQDVRAPALIYPHSLARAVEWAVDKISPGLLRPVGPADAGVAFQSRTLLALLTFSYARQVYSSTAILEQLRRNLSSLRLNEHEVPDAPALLRFRCENRGPLSFCLELALRFLAEERIRQGLITHVKESCLVQEANRRIIMAMFTDSMELGNVPMPEAPMELWFGVANERGRIH
jgi:hypothetical protein